MRFQATGTINFIYLYPSLLSKQGESIKKISEKVEKNENVSFSYLLTQRTPNYDDDNDIFSNINVKFFPQLF